MATADPECGIDSLFGVSNKLQSKVNLFRVVIERKKLEVRRVSKEMRSLIKTTEEAIIRELDTILEEVNTKMGEKKKETQTKIQEFEAKAREMEKLYKEISPESCPLFNVAERIDSVKSEMDIDIPNVKLTWRMDELKDCIKRMCRCDYQILVYDEDTRYQLEWSKCERGTGDTQLDSPWGIATNPINKNIYVADQGNHRVQIFSREGEWIRSVKDDEMISPQNILFHNQSIYVQCIEAILELNEFTEKKKSSKSYDFDLCGSCTDNFHIYVGKRDGMKLIMLTLDLVEETRISLKTEFCNQNAQIRDISLSQGLFYILLSETEFPIQVFSGEGILTSCVVKKDSINSAHCFYLDQQHNIFVADNGDSKVKIFSNEGQLLTQFDGKKSGEGLFKDLLGISVDEFGSIFTVGWKSSGSLQSFTIIS